MQMSQFLRCGLAFLAISCAAHADELSQLGPLRASAGQAVSGYLEVPALSDARCAHSGVAGTRRQ